MKPCSICNENRGKLKISCKYNTHKITYRDTINAPEEYVPRIGFKIKKKGEHLHCSDYVHAFCALDKSLREGPHEDTDEELKDSIDSNESRSFDRSRGARNIGRWKHQFVIEKDIQTANGVVPMTNPDEQYS